MRNEMIVTQTAGMERQAKEIIVHAWEKGWRAGFDEAKKQAEERKEQGTYNQGYEKGYADAKATEDDSLDKAYNDGKKWGYKRGLDNAWMAARKVYEMDGKKRADVMGCSYPFGQLSAAEAIERLKAYEQAEEKQDDDNFRVGECVQFKGGTMQGIITEIDNGNISVLQANGQIIHTVESRIYRVCGNCLEYLEGYEE